jgi:sensor histidine kinase YesM
MTHEHIKHPRIEERTAQGPHLIKDEHIGLNGKIALFVTKIVSTMWCAYIFAAIALIGLPSALNGGAESFISWLAQTFLQLVLLSVIMVGQKVSAKASDKKALQTYKDAEALLEMQDEIRELIKRNNSLTEEVRDALAKR